MIHKAIAMTIANTASELPGNANSPGVARLADRLNTLGMVRGVQSAPKQYRLPFLVPEGKVSFALEWSPGSQTVEVVAQNEESAKVRFNEKPMVREFDRNPPVSGEL
jgi:hypothetical protein